MSSRSGSDQCWTESKAPSPLCLSHFLPASSSRSSHSPGAPPELNRALQSRGDPSRARRVATVQTSRLRMDMVSGLGEEPLPEGPGGVILGEPCSVPPHLPLFSVAPPPAGSSPAHPARLVGLAWPLWLPGGGPENTTALRAPASGEPWSAPVPAAVLATRL